MIKVPFVNLGLQYKNYKKPILNKFDLLSSNGEYVLGKEYNRGRKSLRIVIKDLVNIINA